MVLEQLYSSNWLEQKARYAFLMGIAYSIIGIAVAIFLSTSNFIANEEIGLASIFLISLLLVPSLNRLLLIEEKQITRENKFNVILLFRDHWDIIKVYTFLFLGMMLTFSMFSLMWPKVATLSIFTHQANIVPTLAGRAVAGGHFLNVLGNNIGVLLLILIGSFIYGAGAIFLLTLNASVWGTIFALYIKTGVFGTNYNIIIGFILLMIAIFFHLILESGSYFLAIIAGGIVSKAVIRERLFSKRFTIVIQDALYIFIIAIIVLILAAFVETYFTPSFIKILGVG